MKILYINHKHILAPDWRILKRAVKHLGTLCASAYKPAHWYRSFIPNDAWSGVLAVNILRDMDYDFKIVED